MNTVNIRDIVIDEEIPKICMPIVERTKEELLSEVEMLRSVPINVMEWHMDWFKEVECCEKTVAMLQVLREAMSEMPILAAFHSKKEGGELKISTAAYVELNKAIIDSGDMDSIGVELFTGKAQVKELVAHARDKGVRIIVSNHDFSKTPSYNEILAHLKAMQTLGTDIPKAAVMPIYKADIITPLQATNDMHESFADRPITTMSVAGTGVLSGLHGEAFGSALTFGAARKASAPGQMGVEDLKAVLSLLHKSL